MTFLSRFLRISRYMAMALLFVAPIFHAHADNECNPIESVSIHVKIDEISMYEWFESIGVAQQMMLAAGQSSYIPNSTNYEYTLNQCSEDPSSYDLTNTYSGLRCYIAMPSAADRYCNDTSDSNMCGEDGTIYSPEQYTYAFFVGNVTAEGNDEKIVLDAAGNPVSNINEALDLYFNTYQNDFATWLFNNERNLFYNNGCSDILSTINLFCVEDTYLTNAPLVANDGNTYSLPIDTFGTPLFSNVYYPNMDGYAIAYQLDSNLLTPPVVYYDFRRDTSTNYGYGAYINLTNTSDPLYNNATGYNVGPYDDNNGITAYDIYTSIGTPYGSNIDDFILALESHDNPYYSVSWIDLTDTDYIDSLQYTLDESGLGYYDGSYLNPQTNIQLLNYYDGAFDYADGATGSQSYPEYGSDTTECIGDEEGFGIVPTNGAPAGSGGGSGGNGESSQGGNSCSTGYHYANGSCVANTYTVTFSSNNATSGSPGISSVNCTYGQNCPAFATVGTLVKTGYTFAGWNTASDGSGTDYVAGATPQNLTTTNGATISLYARWTANTYDITYNLDNGTNNNSNPEYYSITDSAITLQKPTRSNYIFAGWCTDSAKTNCALTQTIASGSTGNKEYWAKWEAVKFWVSTSGFSANEEFSFRISASGVFYIDWGDGTVEEYDRTNNTTAQYKTHTYTTAVPSGTQIKFGGRATGYTTSTNAAEYSVFQFGYSNADQNNISGIENILTPEKITAIGGRLGALFPSLDNNSTGYAYIPRFRSTFAKASNLTSIPGNLFYDANDIQNSAFGYTSAMFMHTFSETKITAVPAGLFSGVTGVASYMFYGTFSNCYYNRSVPTNLFGSLAASTANPTYAFAQMFFSNSRLTSIPGDLFSGLTASAERMFSETFVNCAFTELPHNLFSGVTTGATYMFYRTFEANSSLTTIPGDLFANTLTTDTYMFMRTFQDCKLLDNIPSNLFSGLTGGAKERLFYLTFYGCKALTKVPSGLFASVTGAAAYEFYQTFMGCSALTEIESNVFGGVTGGATYMFAQTFQDCENLTTIASGLFSGVTKLYSYMFNGTFLNCKELTTLPNGLFAINSAGATRAFQKTFGNCYKLYDLGTGLFNGITSGANYMFYGTFSLNTNLVSVPSGLFSTIKSGGEYMFYQTFIDCKYLKTLPENLFYNITSNNNKTSMFSETFKGCTALGPTLPNHLFRVTYPNSSQFTRTFQNCTSLTTLPDDLFQSFGTFPTNTAVGGSAFSGTFQNSGLTSIPANLFSKVNCTGNTFCGGNMFANTFNGTKITTIPHGLFDTVQNFNDGLTFQYTFANCTELESIPADLFAQSKNIGASSAENIVTFKNTFAGDTELDTIDYYRSDGTIYYSATPATGNNFLPSNFFGTALDSSVAGRIVDMFSDTGLRTSCPTGTTHYSPTYASTGMNSKVMCSYNVTYNLNGGTNNIYNPTTYIDNTTDITLSSPTKIGYDFGGWYTDSGFTTGNEATNIPAYSYGPKTVYAKWDVAKFSLTTSSTNTFSFKISAKGTFTVDCGNGGTLSGNGVGQDGLTITKTDTTNYTYTCTWGTAATQTIHFDGLATEYNSTTPNDTPVAAISFYTSSANAQKVEYINGSLGLIFPTLTDVSLTNTLQKQPRFFATFMNTKISMVPSTLFYGVSGGADRMFQETFRGIYRLTSLPNGFFSGITGGGQYMFASTFVGCSLTTLPNDLFSTVTTPAAYMFESTFGGNALTGLDANLFSGLTTPAVRMFNSTFKECRSLSSLPSKLFGSIVGGSDAMFGGTFNGCTSLTTIPYDLFYQNNNAIRSVRYRTFVDTFKGCTGLTNVPSGLFSKIDATGTWSASSTLFLRTFEGCTSLKRVPYDLFDFPYFISADRQMFQETFNGCTALDTVVHPGPDNTTYETNFLTKKFFGSSATLSTYYSGMFINMFQNTGLAQSCPNGTSAQSGINANYDFNGKAFCEYNITQENLGGGTPATPTTYIDNASAITLGNPTREGYDFVGWYEDAEFETEATAPQISAYSHGEQKFWAKWTPILYQCPAGQYLPKGNDWASNNYNGCVQCPADNYCPTSGEYTFNNTTDQGITACPPSHPYSPAGMWNATQCGRKLHLGDEVLYLHQSPANPTTHKFKINYSLNDTNYSANAVPRDMNSNTFPKMSAGATKGLHVMIDGVEYLVCDDSVCPNTPAAE